MMGGGSSPSRILIRTRGKVTSRSGDEKLLKYGVCRPASLPKSGETHFSEKWGNIICFLHRYYQEQTIYDKENDIRLRCPVEDT